MNKKAMARMWWILSIGAFVILVFILMSASFGLSLKKITEFWKELFVSTEKSIEELKKATQVQIKDDSWKRFKEYKEIDEMKGILIVASNYITGENKKETFVHGLKNGSKAKFTVGGGNDGNDEKKPNYDGAIKKYLEYSSKCKYSNGGPTVASCTLPKTGIQFRILNVLKEKFYVLIKEGTIDEANKEFASLRTDLGKLKDYLISREEFDNSIYLIYAVSYTREKAFETANIYLEKYKDKDEFNAFYNQALIRYLMINKVNDKELCNINTATALEQFEKVVEITNRKLGLKRQLNALDYKFIKEPYDELKSFIRFLCTTP